MKLKSLSIAVARILVLPVLGLAQSVPTYTVTTIVGNGAGGYGGDGGAATSAQIDVPTNLFIDSKGVLYIGDQANARIRAVTGTNIATVAGNGIQGYSGDKAAATSAQLNAPDTAITDSKGNLYISDSSNNVIRMVTGTTIDTTVGNFAVGFGFGGDGQAANSASTQLYKPTGLAIDSSGNLYIADTFNNRIRRVVNNIISTYAGGATAGSNGNGGPPAVAHLNAPRALAFGPDGTLYIADSKSNMIRKISGGTINLVAGSSTGISGFSGDGGQAVGAQLWNPTGVAVDSCSNVYIADSTNNRIRMVTSNGTISTIAGNGTFGYSGDGGPATSAQLFNPSGVAVDSSFRVYVADTQNNVIRLLTPGAPPPCGNTPPTIKAGGVINASSYGGASAIAPGSWIEIYGSNLAADSRMWGAADFNGINAPTSLDRTTVTIASQNAFVYYISNGQLDVQVPSTIGTGDLPLTVGTAAGNSATYTIHVNPVQPGFLAPPAFLVGGKQYVVATLTDGVTYIAPPGSIPGLATRQAKPGETIILYGIGFGPVSPNIIAGQIVQQSNSITTPFSLFIGSAQVTPAYSGLAGNFVGLYEFYFTVPPIADSDLVPVTFTLNGINGTQTLYTAVKH